MSLAEENGQDFGGDDIVAAEYVVGVLPAEERAAASRRVDTEPAFARLVDQWEVRFAPLADVYPSVEPPASVKQVIDRRLAGGAAATPAASSSPGLWASLAFWRGLATAAVAALALYVAVPLINPPGPSVEEPRYVANMVADGSAVHFLAVYDRGDGEIGLTHVAGPRPDGRDFELWMIEGQNAPVSMGVIPQGETAHIRVSDTARAKLAAGAVLAVSSEPLGGSTTGAPTGPVVAAGDLKDI